MSFRFTAHQSERSEIRSFPGPMNVSSLVSVDRQLDRDWRGDQYSITSANQSYRKSARKSVNCRRDGILTIEKAGLLTDLVAVADRA
jgi:hypothetical protein